MIGSRSNIVALDGGANQNYWSLDGGLTAHTLTGTTDNMYNLTFNNNPTCDLDLNVTSADCWAGTSTKKRENGTLSMLNESDSCAFWLNWGEDNSSSAKFASAAYDTLKHYIESCYDEPNSSVAFLSMDGAASRIGKNSLDELVVMQKYREWLKSVIYLNRHDDLYFCRCLNSIEGTFGNDDDNAHIAVIDFINNQSRRTDSASYHSLWDTRISIRTDQIREWRDTVEDSIATPLDTTEPSLQSIGLGLLLDGVASQSSPATGTEIISLIPRENPFRKQTEVVFQLNFSEVARIEVFNVLGQSVFESPRKSFEAGSNSILLALGDCSAGSYYVRLSTAGEDIKTIRLVKE